MVKVKVEYTGRKEPGSNQYVFPVRYDIVYDNKGKVVGGSGGGGDNVQYELDKQKRLALEEQAKKQVAYAKEQQAKKLEELRKNIQLKQIKQQQDLAQAQRQQQFSGIVEESFKGTQQAKKYYVQGEEVGSIQYEKPKTYSSGGFNIEETSGLSPVAVVRQPSKIITPETTYELNNQGVSVTQIKRTQPYQYPLLQEQPTQQLNKDTAFQTLLKTGVVGFPGSTYIFNPEKTKSQIDLIQNAGVKEMVFGEAGKEFVGVGFPGQQNIFTLQEAKTFIGSKGIVGGVASQFIPTNPGEIAIAGATAGAYGIAPKIIKLGISGYSTYSGVKGVLDTSLTKEERIASGIFAGFGVLGTTYESLPYLRGFKARLSKKYTPVVKTEVGFKAISEVSLTNKEKTMIGLIPEKSPLKSGLTTSINLQKTSPLKRGGFGVKDYEKQLFIGPEQLLSTSQRGFFKAGKEIPIEREFFVTPQEPTLKIPETRISRLGLSDLFKFTNLKNTELSLSFPKPAQIGIIKAGVGRKETASIFKIGKTSELEAIKSFGSIKDINKIGVTTIKGQGVDIYSFNIEKGTKGAKIKTTTSTTSTKQTTSLFGLLSPTGFVSASQITETTKPTTSISKSLSLSQVMNSYPTEYKTTQKIKLASAGITTKKTKGGSSTIPTPSLTTIIKTPKSPPTRIPIYPILPKTPSYPIPRITRTPIILTPYKPNKYKEKNLFNQKMPKNIFSVEIKRRGKFKPYGIFESYEKAFTSGLGYVRGSLGKSFKVSGVGNARLPKDIRFSKKQKGVFVQRNVFGLSSPGEKREISLSRALKFKVPKQKGLYSSKKKRGRRNLIDF